MIGFKNKNLNQKSNPLKMAKTKKARATKRAHFSVRAIRNANPRQFRAHRAGSVLARIFSF